MSSIKRLVGARLAELRKAAGISQGELARRVDTSQREISQYERGHTFPRPERLDAILGALGVTPEAFLGAEPARGSDLSRLIAFAMRETERDPTFPIQALRVLRAISR